MSDLACKMSNDVSVSFAKEVVLLDETVREHSHELRHVPVNVNIGVL